MAAPVPQLDPEKMQIVQDLEIEMMSDMYNRMTAACHKKCVPPKYKDAELAKGESVCLDRCVAKYLEIHERVGRKLTQLSMQDEEALKKLQGEMPRM
jgi:mitochondrial import inner membrane translocase subunit TIM10